MDVEAIVLAAQAGDLDALNRLARWMYVLLDGYAGRRLDPADMDELRQRTAEVILSKLGSFESSGPGSFRRWVLKVASFEVMATEREPFRERGRRAKLAELIASPTTGLEGKLDRGQQAALAEQCLAQLPAHERQAIEHRVEGGDDAELAEREGVTLAAIRSRRHRGRRRLEALMAAAMAKPRREATPCTPAS